MVQICQRTEVVSVQVKRWSGQWERPPRWPSGKASASKTEDPGFESRLRRDFFGVESHQLLKNRHSSGSLPGAWSYRVSAGTGRPGVSIL